MVCVQFTCSKLLHIFCEVLLCSDIITTVLTECGSVVEAISNFMVLKSNFSVEGEYGKIKVLVAFFFT